MVLKGLPPNLKLFATVITEKKKTITYFEFKIFLSYENKERMSYSKDESNNILQMKTTFKGTKPKNNPGVSTHSQYDCKSTSYYYNDYNKPHHSSKNNTPPRHTHCQERNWIVWKRNVLTIKPYLHLNCVLMLNWIVWNRNVFHKLYLHLNCILMLDWIVWNRTIFIKNGFGVK